MTGRAIGTLQLRAAVTTGLLALSLTACASFAARTRSSVDAGTDRSASTTTNGTLSPRQTRLALAAAHREVDHFAPKLRSDLDGWPANVTAVTATVEHKTITDSNTGSQCDSGTVVVIRLIGKYDTIQTGGVPPDPGPVTGVNATVDFGSGEVCLVGVEVGPITPEPGASILFKR